MSSTFLHHHSQDFQSMTMTVQKNHLRGPHGLRGVVWTWRNLPEGYTTKRWLNALHDTVHRFPYAGEDEIVSRAAHPAGKGQMMEAMKVEKATTTETKKQIEIAVRDPWGHSGSGAFPNSRTKVSDIERRIEWLTKLKAQIERMYDLQEPGWELKEVSLKSGGRQVTVVGAFVPVSDDASTSPETTGASQGDEKASSDVQRMTANVQRLSDTPLIPRYCIHCGGLLTNKDMETRQRCTVCGAVYGVTVSVSYG